MVELLVMAALAASGADRPSQEYARAALTSITQVRTIQRSEEDVAEAARQGPHACLEDWAARPEALTEELLTFYDVVTSAPLWPAERPPQAALVAAVDRTRGIGTYGPLRKGRRLLRAQLAFIDELYSQPIDACAEVKAWRASGWALGARPPQIARVHRVIARTRKELRDSDRRMFHTIDFIRRHAATLGNRLLRQVWIGIEPPENRDNCDDVLVAVAPEEAFCG
jgi:hypothetical protein